MTTDDKPTIGGAKEVPLSFSIHIVYGHRAAVGVWHRLGLKHPSDKAMDDITSLTKQRAHHAKTSKKEDWTY